MFWKVCYNNLFLLIIILAAKLPYILHAPYTIDGDEGVVAIMGKHIAEGKEFPLFFYGQSYMGSLEASLFALAYKFTSLDMIYLVRLIPLFIMGLSLFFIIRVLKHLRMNPLKYLVFWVFPSAFTIIWGLKLRGGFIDIVLFYAIFLDLLLQYKSDKSTIKLYLLFFITGFAFYVNMLIAPLIIGTVVLYRLQNFKEQKFSLQKYSSPKVTL